MKALMANFPAEHMEQSEAAAADMDPGGQERQEEAPGEEKVPGEQAAQVEALVE